MNPSLEEPGLIPGSFFILQIRYGFPGSPVLTDSFPGELIPCYS